MFFRDSNTGSARVFDGDAATSTVICNTFMEFGVETLTRNQPAFLNMTKRFLLEQLPLSAPTREALEHRTGVYGWPLRETETQPLTVVLALGRLLGPQDEYLK